MNDDITLTICSSMLQLTEDTLNMASDPVYQKNYAAMRAKRLNGFPEVVQ